ncbi:MAG: N-acetylglucosamine-6-phosphate deacetylase [Victivallaceae bacterium]|nr:N-acetylglucosamine-6-phosphate deacetylase [Victivallaceae bacterium]
MSTLLLRNATLLVPGIRCEHSALLIENGLIAAVFGADDRLPAEIDSIDCGGGMVAAGFVDVHCHGFGGFDFCDGSMEAISTMAKGKLAEGVTTLLPTTLTVAPEQLKQALRSAREFAASGLPGCRIPGVHLEGPYVNPKSLGAQNPDFVRRPDLAEIDALNAIWPVKKVTYAVEIPGGNGFAAELLKRGILPSCGHSCAGYADLKPEYDAGLRDLTHYCNRMTPLHHREIGLVGSGLLLTDLRLEIICDGIHLSPDMIKLIFALKSPRYIELITDAMRASGMPDGQYDLGGLAVTVRDNAARLADGALAGSTLGMNRALRNAVKFSGLAAEQVVESSSLTQLTSLKLPGGRLAAGEPADIVVMKPDFSVAHTIVGGRILYSAK